MGLCSHKDYFGISAEWVLFATGYCKSPCDSIGGAVKRHPSNQSLQSFLNNQILDYKAMLDLCENEMILIKFFGISKESMISVENLEKWYEGGETVPGKQSSHSFVPFSSSRIGHKLTSEDESYVDTHDFNVPTLFEIGEVSSSAYVTCIYSSFWWVGMVSLVDISAGHIIIIDFMYPHGPQKTFN